MIVIISFVVSTFLINIAVCKIHCFEKKRRFTPLSNKLITLLLPSCLFKKTEKTVNFKTSFAGEKHLKEKKKELKLLTTLLNKKKTYCLIIFYLSIWPSLISSEENPPKAVKLRRPWRNCDGSKWKILKNPKKKNKAIHFLSQFPHFML